MTDPGRVLPAPYVLRGHGTIHRGFTGPALLRRRSQHRRVRLGAARHPAARGAAGCVRRDGRSQLLEAVFGGVRPFLGTGRPPPAPDPTPRAGIAREEGARAWE